MSRFTAWLCLIACALGLVTAATQGLWFLAFLFLLLTVWSCIELAGARRTRELPLAPAGEEG